MTTKNDTRFCADNFINSVLHITSLEKGHPLYDDTKDRAYFIRNKDYGKFLESDIGHLHMDDNTWNRDDGIVHLTSSGSKNELIDKFRKINMRIGGIAIFDNNNPFGFRLVKLDNMEETC